MRIGYFSGSQRATLVELKTSEQSLCSLVGSERIKITRQNIGGVDFDVVSRKRCGRRVSAIGEKARLSGTLLFMHEGRDVTHEETMLINNALRLHVNRDGIPGLVVSLK